MRILELFSGIGAVSAAVSGEHEIACAVDINQLAKKVYKANFESPFMTQEITSLSDAQLSQFETDFWWMSPPCQPFTRRGLQKDIEDSRTLALLRIINAIRSLRPRNIALENVLGFEQSETYALLVDTLNCAGYHHSQIQLCASDFGHPNLRPRFFLAASLACPPKLEPPQHDEQNQNVSTILQSEDQLPDGLSVQPQQLTTYHHAVNVVDGNSNTTRCFTSAYGKSNVRSGSYLQTSHGYRRFSPREIARLLGLPDNFVLPSELTTRQLWKLLGNAVHVACVKHVISAFQQTR